MSASCGDTLVKKESLIILVNALLWPEAYSGDGGQQSAKSPSPAPTAHKESLVEGIEPKTMLKHALCHRATTLSKK